MALRTVEEQKLLSEKRRKRKETIRKFKADFMSSLFIGIKIGGTAMIIAILLYLAAKWLLKWDLFYETDLKYPYIVLIITIMFFVIALLCFFVAFILYNTKHRRNTKYKEDNKGAKNESKNNAQA